jgi:hypothetical protein
MLTQADQDFQRYLRDHGYDGADDHEPDLGISRRPDFRIGRAGAQAICEVKQFDNPSPLEKRIVINPVTARPQPFSAGDDEVYGPIRQQVHAAARQLKGLRGRGIPLVAVLSNPNGRWVNLDVHHAVHALYGNPTFGGPYNPKTGRIESLGPVRGRDGEITNDHQYLSAVVLLHRRTHAADARAAWLDANRDRLATQYPDRTERSVGLLTALDGLDLPDGDYLHVDVIHTTPARLGRIALLDPALFDGPHDRHWVVNPDGTYSKGVHKPDA